jgi:esterase/lipase superfamily enzyme
MKNYFFPLLFGLIFLVGCQPKVYLMPSPVGMAAEGQLFRKTKELQDDNYLYTLYATNRQPNDPDNSSGGYSIFPSDSIRLGWTVHRVGDEGMSWEEILEQSLKSDRSKDLLLTSEYSREIVSHQIGTGVEEISAQANGYFYELDTILDRTFDKDILIYVHGANCNFYRATAQGAQFFHFTGHNTIVLTFSWPSAENLFKYKTDVLHAKKTVPAFAELIELLATHTKARNINILAYSAGAQVVAPGLAYLRGLYPDESPESLSKRLRIGEVYFAAPDTAFEPFIERYIKFKDIVKRTTINLNRNDVVLKLSAMQNGVSRLGRPDATELTEDERRIILDVMNTPKLNVIDVGDSAPLDIGRAHDSWYNHPWVSMDALSLLLLNLDPLERGLEEHLYGGVGKTYRFPDNYETDFRKRVEGIRELIEEKARIRHGQ